MLLPCLKLTLFEMAPMFIAQNWTWHQTSTKAGITSYHKVASTEVNQIQTGVSQALQPQWSPSTGLTYCFKVGRMLGDVSRSSTFWNASLAHLRHFQLQSQPIYVHIECRVMWKLLTMTSSLTSIITWAFVGVLKRITKETSFWTTNLRVG